MKVVVIHGSPRRKNSATYKIADHIVNGMKKKNSDVEEFFLADMKINHCVGCFTCWTKTPGKCIHNDDMEQILESIKKADLVIHASPLYYFDVTGLFKNFTDRQLPLIQPYLVDHGDTTGHPYRGEGQHPKVFLVSVCGFQKGPILMLSLLDTRNHMVKE
ncbi:MAG: flavodoxin family protein [Caldisericia bacterium]